jgi:hypothetical protein
VVGVRGKEMLCVGDLASQSISCIPLTLPGQGSRADTGLPRCGRCPGGDKRGGEGVGGVGLERCHPGSWNSTGRSSAVRAQ